jgi:hypothetical protein
MYDSEDANQFSGEDFEQVGGVGSDASLVAKLDWGNEVVGWGVVDHLPSPEVPGQHV